MVVQTEEKVRIIDGRGNELNEGGLAMNAGVELGIDEVSKWNLLRPTRASPYAPGPVVRNRDGYRYGLEFLWNSRRL